MTDFNTIDKLTATLFAFTPTGDDRADATAIVSAYSALSRKLKAAKLGGHDVVVRPKETIKARPENKSFAATHAVALLEAEIEDLKAQLASAKMDTKHANGYSDSLQDDLDAAGEEVSRWKKMAGDYEHDLNKALGMMAEHGYDSQSDSWATIEQPSCVIEAMTAAVTADRAMREDEYKTILAEREAIIAAQGQRIDALKNKVHDLHALFVA